MILKQTRKWPVYKSISHRCKHHPVPPFWPTFLDFFRKSWKKWNLRAWRVFGKSVTCDNVTSKSGGRLKWKLTVSEGVLVPDHKVSTKPDQNETHHKRRFHSFMNANFQLVYLSDASRPGLPGESSYFPYRLSKIILLSEHKSSVRTILKQVWDPCATHVFGAEVVL